MRSSKITLAGSYLLLLMLLIAVGYVALLRTTNGQTIPEQAEPQLYTPTYDEEEISGSSVSATVGTTSTIYPTAESEHLQALTPADKSTSPMDPYPPPNISVPIDVESVGNTPYPEPNLVIPNQGQNLLMYPGPGTEQPIATRVPFVTQAPNTAVPPGATPSAIVAIDPTPLGNLIQTTLTPEATITQGVIRTEILVSDPKTFQIVSGRMQFVEFFAFWSPISKSMAPVVNVLADRYKDRINFVFLDIDAPENGLYKQLIGNRLPPIFLMLDPQGGVLSVWDGYVPYGELESALQTALP